MDETFKKQKVVSIEEHRITQTPEELHQEIADLSVARKFIEFFLMSNAETAEATLNLTMYDLEDMHSGLLRELCVAVHDITESVFGDELKIPELMIQIEDRVRRDVKLLLSMDEKSKRT
ncbi:hypothetical protein HY311_04040 [Candidatus Nomurabacteria bacterium]|nr:hypothetical protein [Candidatus Nomurabacteria bacterium]